MKKIMIFMICVISSVVFTSCTSNKVLNESTLSNSDLFGESKNKCIESTYFSSLRDVVETEKGYYILQKNDELIYAEKNDGDTMYLCARPDCEHTNSKGKLIVTCNASIPTYVPGTIAYYDSHIYFVTYDAGTYRAMLNRCDIYGNGREELFCVGKLPGRRSELELIFNDGYLYILQQSTDTLDELRRYDLSDGSEKLLIRFTEQETPQMVKIYDGALYYSVKNVEDYNKSRIERYVIEKEKTEIVLSDTYTTCYTIDWTTDTILYWIYGDGLYRRSLESGQAVKIISADETNIRCEVAFNGKEIYIYNYLTYLDRKREGNRIEKYIAMYDAEGIELAKRVIPNRCLAEMCSTEHIVINDLFEYEYISSDLRKQEAEKNFEPIS